MWALHKQYIKLHEVPEHHLRLWGSWTRSPVCAESELCVKHVQVRVQRG